MTELLYMNDFDVETGEATVLALETLDDGRVDIILDKTCFYPRGGGQDWDMGEVTTDTASVVIEEVRLDENGVVHHIGMVRRGEVAPGDAVSGKVDHKRRQVNTRLHSAGHVIDRAIDGLGLDWIATKGQHYPHLSAVEYSGTWDSENAEQLRMAIEERVNEYIGNGSTNTLQFMTPDEMKTVCKHVPANLPQNKPSRIVMYDDFGIPCGGTHVSNINQIGKIAIQKLKAKKGVIRVTYSVDGIS